MNVAIIGYGKMGREIERILLDRGHTISVIIDAENLEDFNSDKFRSSDVALEFTSPAAAYNNLVSSIEAGVPVVSGTTGWLDKFEELKALCAQKNGALFYASNYSLGVNLLFRLNQELAQLMNRFKGYDVEIEEVHHTQKLDSPSGTAITLADDIISRIDGKSEWKNEASEQESVVPIISYREGLTPGNHSVTYTSEDDVLEIRHTIKNRRTLAFGAVVAAEFLCGKHGVFTMDDLLYEA